MKSIHIYILFMIFLLLSCSKSSENRKKLISRNQFDKGNQVNTENQVETEDKFEEDRIHFENNRTYSDKFGAKFKLNLKNESQVKQMIFDLCVYRYVKKYSHFNVGVSEYIDVKYKLSKHNFSIKYSKRKKDVFIIATIKHKIFSKDYIEAFIFLEKLGENYYGNLGALLSSACLAPRHEIIDIDRDNISEIKIITDISGNGYTDEYLTIYKNINGTFRPIFNEGTDYSGPWKTFYKNDVKFINNRTGYAEILLFVRIYKYRSHSNGCINFTDKPYLIKRQVIRFSYIGNKYRAMSGYFDYYKYTEKMRN